MYILQYIYRYLIQSLSQPDFDQGQKSPIKFIMERADRVIGGVGEGGGQEGTS